MKRLLVLGAGTAGTMVVNKLRKRLDRAEWQITVVDQDPTHYYQPGYLLMPFGVYNKNDVVKPKRDFIPAGVEMILCEIDAIEADKNQVRLSDGRVLPLRLPCHRHRRGHPTRPDARAAGRRVGQVDPELLHLRGRDRAGKALSTPGKAAGWSSTWSKTPSSARWRRSSSSCWPIGSSTSAAFVIASSSST